jgi:hypothetical protein
MQAYIIKFHVNGYLSEEKSILVLSYSDNAEGEMIHTAKEALIRGTYVRGNKEPTTTFINMRHLDIDGVVMPGTVFIQ